MNEINLVTMSDMPRLFNEMLEKEPVVKIDWSSKTVDIYGGDSGYTQSNPYWIGFSDASADWWLTHMAEKNWATPMMIAKLAAALHEVRANVVSN